MSKRPFEGQQGKKVTASNVRIAELILDVEEGRLEVKPFFQRRLVWTNKDKELLIDTVLKGYPFPEIFIAYKSQGSSLKRPRWLVDGQQRVSTLQSYYKGSPDILHKTITRFAKLSELEQTRFLDYEVAVRDLGTANNEIIREIFRRINSTDYALKSMEVLNAMFSGAYKSYCAGLAGHEFFKRHEAFSAAVQKRMYDVTFCVILVGTLLGGYYRRDERNEEFLERYNDEFPEQDKIQTGLDQVFDFVDSCGFPKKSRIWQLTDLFTVLVELYSALHNQNKKLDPLIVGKQLQRFFEEVDQAYAGSSARTPEVVTYLKAATKATNDKYARIERAQVIARLLGTKPGPAAEEQSKRPTNVKKTAKKAAKKGK